MGFFGYLSILPVLVGMVMAVVNAVEALKSGTLGADKKKAVLDSFGSTWEAIQKEFKVKEPFSVFAPILGVLIDLVVAVFNTVGYFQHAGTGKEA